MENLLKVSLLVTLATNWVTLTHQLNPDVVDSYHIGEVHLEHKADVEYHGRHFTNLLYSAPLADTPLMVRRERVTNSVTVNAWIGTNLFLATNMVITNITWEGHWPILRPYP